MAKCVSSDSFSGVYRLCAEVWEECEFMILEEVVSAADNDLTINFTDKRRKLMIIIKHLGWYTVCCKENKIK